MEQLLKDTGSKVTPVVVIPIAQLCVRTAFQQAVRTGEIKEVGAQTVKVPRTLVVDFGAMSPYSISSMKEMMMFSTAQR